MWPFEAHCSKEVRPTGRAIIHFNITELFGKTLLSMSSKQLEYFL
jgi:hypothetical protein